MKIIRKSALGLAVIALSAGIFSGSALADVQTQGISDNEIRIGAFGPFGGPVYLYGKLVMNGVEAVFDMVNESGGVHGRKLTLVREDDNCKPEGSIAAVKKLAYSEKVFAIVGGACSNATLASVPELVKSGIPMVINSAVADAISTPVKKWATADRKRGSRGKRSRTWSQCAMRWIQMACRGWWKRSVST